ncbi:MAG: hypothetical protein OHK0017_07910 [Patescibacteria group bacterium]
MHFYPFGFNTKNLPPSNSPVIISGLQGWYDSTKILSSGGFVDQLTDQSGNNRHLTQVSTARPAVNASGRNGNQTILFDGISHILNGSVVPITNEYTWIFVTNLVTRPAGTRSPFSNGNSSTGFSYRIGTSNDRSNVHNGAGVMGDGILTLNSWECVSIQRSSSPLATMKVNNSSVSLLNNNLASLLTPSGNLSLGGRAGAEFSNINFGELIIYNRVISDTELDNIWNGYLKTKWGF